MRGYRDDLETGEVQQLSGKRYYCAESSVLDMLRGSQYPNTAVTVDLVYKYPKVASSKPMRKCSPSLRFLFSFFFQYQKKKDDMDTHIADDKLRELHIEDTTVKANNEALEYELDPVAEKKLLRKIDLHVVPILWFLFM